MLYYIIFLRAIFLLDSFVNLIIAVQDCINTLTNLPSFSVHIHVVWQIAAPLFDFWLWLQAGIPPYCSCRLMHALSSGVKALTGIG